MSGSSVKASSTIATHDLWRARAHLLEILEGRGYDVSEYAHIDVPTLDIMAKKNEMDMLVTHTQTGTKMYIHHCFASYFSSKHVENTVDDLYLYNQVLTKDDTLWILTKDEPNQSVQLFLKRLWDKEQVYVVVLHWKRLLFNLLKHSAVPPHEIMTEEEVHEVRSKYNIVDDDQWPRLSRFDPVAQLIGLRPGQVCRITRPSRTAVRTYYYRRCV